MRFQIKSVFFVTTIVAILVVWYLDRRRLSQRLDAANSTTTEKERMLAFRESIKLPVKLRSQLTELSDGTLDIRMPKSHEFLRQQKVMNRRLNEFRSSGENDRGI